MFGRTVAFVYQAEYRFTFQIDFFSVVWCLFLMKVLLKSVEDVKPDVRTEGDICDQ